MADPNVIPKKIIEVFDCDQRKTSCKSENLSEKFVKPRVAVARSIENHIQRGELSLYNFAEGVKYFPMLKLIEVSVIKNDIVPFHPKLASYLVQQLQ